MATKNTPRKAPVAQQNMKRWNVFMSEDMLAALEAEAERKETTSAELVRKAVAKDLRRLGYYSIV